MPRDAGKMMTGATVTVIATATTVDAPAARIADTATESVTVDTAETMTTTEAARAVMEGARIETDVGHATADQSGRARQIAAARGAEMEIGTIVPGGMILETGGTAVTARPIPLRDAAMPDALGLLKSMGRRLRIMRCGLQPAKSTPTQTQTEVDKKAERLRKLQAMKEKHAQKEAKEAAVTAGSTRMLLAEMDQKASGASPGSNSPAAASASPAPASPATPTPYAGKFDPKAIAKSSKGARAQSPARLGEVKLASLGAKPVLGGGGVKPPGTKAAGLLPANRAVSAFGFGKSADSQKSSAKRKVDMDDEEIIKRKLVKLPDFVPENADSTPDAEGEGDEDAEDDLDVLMAQNEEDMAAAHRVLQERRDERIQKEEMAMDVDVDTEAAPNGGAVAANETPQATVMEVDDDVDPLDAFMADLEQVGPVAGFGSRPAVQGGKGAKKAFEPEAYFSDDDYGYEAEDADPSAILAIASKKKKKDIPTIDYSKLELNTIRKNFWVEPQELSQMTDEEAAELRLELDGIKVSGKNVPKPVQKWSQCGLTRPILDVIDTLGYEKPTSIQMQALPVIMSGRDVIGVAKTGSGKTMAFVLPMLRHIKDQDPVTGDDGAIALIMTPTRELCTQIYSDLLPFAKALKLRAIAAYGGNAIKDQIAELKRGAEIIVATPGRLIDLLAANSGRVTNLKRATYLVLDEADRMFDMGFEPQVMKIFNNVRPDRQTILFSATMPRIIDALTKKVLREPVEITVGGRSVVAAEITQVVEILDESKKFVRLLELLGELYADDDDVRALIFVERQEKADDLLREVLRRGYGCMSIHGGKDQEDRNSTISDFKKGVCPIMIATSVAARGLDVKQLKLVVNYDAPNHLEDYVHRAGRTGRAGNTGTAVTFVTEEQENCAPGIAKALEQSGQPVPEQLNEMRKAWKEKVKAGKAKDASGFGGKGLERLDKEREAARIRERKTHKAEGEEEDYKEEETAEEAAKKDKAKSAIEAAASAIVSRESAKAAAAAAADGNNGSGSANAGDVKPSPSGGAAAGEGGSSSTTTAGAASAVTTSGKAGGGGGALDKAASAISEINARLARAGHLRPGQPIDNKGPDAGAFHATLEINDFPQKARWAVTNRTNVAKILEATGTSITTKGNYYAPGKEPPSGADPKLYILIEGDTELVVGKALSELTRLLREGTIAAADAESRAPASGRYTIT
ncbi:P-loop containing nucleoside triphosphate hydrolase protein [Dichotomopilus funicola]|uniref:RNA helicase n=1 Tax=Dichotomopilus funicola TaxID=1934379 RepID=A0AAN6V4G0_9PEZI|nr:P-loop containing nucleoside triphosphate hydrolase protein [Dichotomopilus funicola]